MAAKVAKKIGWKRLFSRLVIRFPLIFAGAWMGPVGLLFALAGAVSTAYMIYDFLKIIEKEINEAESNTDLNDPTPIKIKIPKGMGTTAAAIQAETKAVQKGGALDSMGNVIVAKDNDAGLAKKVAAYNKLSKKEKSNLNVQDDKELLETLQNNVKLLKETGGGGEDTKMMIDSLNESIKFYEDKLGISKPNPTKVKINKGPVIKSKYQMSDDQGNITKVSTPKRNIGAEYQQSLAGINQMSDDQGNITKVSTPKRNIGAEYQQSLAGINQFLHGAVDKEMGSGFFGFNPIKGATHSMVDKEMSQYTDPANVTPKMLGNTRSMMSSKMQGNIDPRKQEYILERFDQFIEKFTKLNAASNTAVSSSNNTNNTSVTNVGLSTTPINANPAVDF